MTLQLLLGAVLGVMIGYFVMPGHLLWFGIGIAAAYLYQRYCR